MRRALLVLVLLGGCAETSTTVPTLPASPLAVAQPPSAVERPPCAVPDLGLRLPFEPTREFAVIQGNGGTFSHDGRDTFSWDFDMPEGTPVLAAAAGVVAEVIDVYSFGAPDRKLMNSDNKIIIDHGGAHFSLYAHLQRASMLVHVGEPVSRGQVIALSGNTGFSSGPHLHFEVLDHRARSLPVCFTDVDGGVPVRGKSYRSITPAGEGGASVSKPPAAPSVLPRDAFNENGITLMSDLPAHVFKGGERVEASALRPARRALAVLYPRDRDGRVRTIAASIGADGRFSLVIPTEVLAELAPKIDFMLVLVGGDGRWSSEFSVPVYFAPPTNALSTGAE